MLINYSVVLFASVLYFKGQKEKGNQTKKTWGEEKEEQGKMVFSTDRTRTAGEHCLGPGCCTLSHGGEPSAGRAG